VTVQSTLNMEKGDQVWVQIWNTLSGEYLADDSEHRTHFTGFMLEEEIAASLWDIFLKCAKWSSTNNWLENNAINWLFIKGWNFLTKNFKI
jgi:hypothetical protein